MVKQRYNSAIVASRIKALRKERGWTQADLADQADISLVSVKLYETKKRIPDNFNINALAKVFRVSPFYLLGETDHKNKWDKYDKEHPEEVKELKLVTDFIESAEALGFFHQDSEDPEKDFEEYKTYNQMYQERKKNMKTRSEIKVVTGASENQIIDNFDTGEITIQAVTEADVEKAFQQLIRRGIVSDH